MAREMKYFKIPQGVKPTVLEQALMDLVEAYGVHMETSPVMRRPFFRTQPKIRRPLLKAKKK